MQPKAGSTDVDESGDAVASGIAIRIVAYESPASRQDRLFLSGQAIAVTKPSQLTINRTSEVLTITSGFMRLLGER